ncbi:MAG: rRNA pseudouridine synthase [Candidatus Krumholzibacteria bacterium]|nr:rRNA pseudouridine synthase [Candidatus Krumholzibacteria bacterium]
MTSDSEMRLNRFLARAGFGSRRSVEDIVREGRVAIDGQKVVDLGRRVSTGTEEVTVDGRPVSLPEDFRVYAFHKPHGVVSTLAAQGGQPSLLPYRQTSDIPDRFMPVGRLDSETTGLLLWTDDGELNQALCRPKSGLWKTYELEINADLAPEKVRSLTRGNIEIDGRACLPCRLKLNPGGTTRQWIMEIHEGRRRQIRRMFRAVGLRVLRLHRTAVGPIKLFNLRAGDFRRLTHNEVESLRELLAGTDTNRKRSRR